MLGLLFNMQFPSNLEKSRGKKGRYLINPVRVAAMVWGFESAGSRKGSTRALPLGIPWRTFLLSRGLHCASRIGSCCSSFPSHCHVGWRPGLYRCSVWRGVRHFLLDFPPLLHFSHKLSSYLCFVILGQCGGIGPGFWERESLDFWPCVEM